MKCPDEAAGADVAADEETEDECPGEGPTLEAPPLPAEGPEGEEGADGAGGDEDAVPDGPCGPAGAGASCPLPNPPLFAPSFPALGPTPGAFVCPGLLLGPLPDGPFLAKVGVAASAAAQIVLNKIRLIIAPLMSP